jgi:ribosomal protein S18 acetylase RimI-like enzyme
MSEDTGNDVVIRRANNGDLPHLGRLGALMVETHHAFDRRRFFAPTVDTPRGYAAFMRTQLGQSAAVIFVADAGSSVVGYAYATLEGYDYLSLRAPAGVLHDLIVEPGHRGRGIGRLLLDTMLSELRARGAPRVVLSTAERNEAAQRLFSRKGFRRTMVEMTYELDEPAGEGPDK